MDLATAQQRAEEVVTELRPYSRQIEIAGSIRRLKRFPNDIDIVLIPGNQGKLFLKLQAMGCTLGGNKLARLRWKGVQVDLYFATPETWATLLLIRTGSKESNISLCSVARRRGWSLKANGDGLFNEEGKRIAGETEGSIFEALKLPYKEPQDRN